jgi:hypothetical protein
VRPTIEVIQASVRLYVDFVWEVVDRFEYNIRKRRIGGIISWGLGQWRLSSLEYHALVLIELLLIIILRECEMYKMQVGDMMHEWFGVYRIRCGFKYFMFLLQVLSSTTT